MVVVSERRPYIPLRGLRGDTDTPTDAAFADPVAEQAWVKLTALQSRLYGLKTQSLLGGRGEDTVDKLLDRVGTLITDQDRPGAELLAQAQQITTEVEAVESARRLNIIIVSLATATLVGVGGYVIWKKV